MALRKLKFTLPFAPLANKETMHTTKGFSYTPKEKKDYMKLCASTMRNFKGRFAGAKCVRLTILFVCERPNLCPEGIPKALWKSLSLQFYKSSRPDADNYLKPLQDSMSNHIIEQTKNKDKEVIKRIRGANIIDDDAVLVSLRIDKVYRRIDQSPQIQIKLQELNNIYEPKSKSRVVSREGKFTLV